MLCAAIGVNKIFIIELTCMNYYENARKCTDCREPRVVCLKKFVIVGTELVALQVSIAVHY
jgi:hypothetical protein